jgi:hypothetical protein
LIANALGAGVSRNPEQELGWTTVHRVANLPETCFSVPEQFNILQWHNETFELPKIGDESAQEDGVEVLEFAEAAISKADVSNAPETPIFDIISNRYKRSGWTKLEQAESK